MLAGVLRAGCGLQHVRITFAAAYPEAAWFRGIAVSFQPAGPRHDGRPRPNTPNPANTRRKRDLVLGLALAIVAVLMFAGGLAVIIRDY